MTIDTIIDPSSQDKMPVKSVIILLFVFSSAFGYGQSAWQHKGDIDSIFADIDRRFRPGFGITVVQDGNVVYENCVGLANVKKRIPFTNQTYFAIASVSKQFTAMCILLLEEQGKLDVDDDIRKYIPELNNYASPITITHLLTHTSGIRDHVTMLEWEKNQKRQFYDFDGTLECLARFNGISFKPGEDFAYSNTGYVLLALIVERVSGISFEEFARINIFEPLQMNNSQFSLHGKRKKFCNSSSYNWKNGSFKKHVGKEVNALGATGVYTTLDDFVKWDQNFYENKLGESGQLIIDKMNTSGQLNGGSSVNYGNGQKYRNYRGVNLIEHSGGWAFFNFQYTRIPSLNMSIVVAANNECDYPIGMVDDILKVLLPVDPNKIELKIPPANPQFTADHESLRINETYFAPNNMLRVLSFTPSGLKVIVPNPYGDKIYRLEKVEKGCYRDSLGSMLCFSPDNESFTWEGGTYFTVSRTFTRVDNTGNVPYVNFMGKYRSPELGDIKIKIRGGWYKLHYKDGFMQQTPLSQLADESFKGDRAKYTIRFMDGYLLLGNERVYNVRFDKIR